MILPKIQLTQTEMDVIAECMTNPAVNKYLTMQGYLMVEALATGMPAEDESDASYLRRAAGVQGGMAMIEQLLAIKKAVPLTTGQ